MEEVIRRNTSPTSYILVWIDRYITTIMAKMGTVHVVLAIAILLSVCEAKRQPQLTSPGVVVVPTLQSLSSTTGNDVTGTNDITTDITSIQANGIKRSIAKSILHIILSTICGEGRAFNLTKGRCTSSYPTTYAFGNPGLGK